LELAELFAVALRLGASNLHLEIGPFLFEQALQQAEIVFRDIDVHGVLHQESWTHHANSAPRRRVEKALPESRYRRVDLAHRFTAGRGTRFANSYPIDRSDAAGVTRRQSHEAHD